MIPPTPFHLPFSFFHLTPPISPRPQRGWALWGSTTHFSPPMSPSTTPPTSPSAYVPPVRKKYDSSSSSASSQPQLPPLLKHKSWSPDIDREQTWLRRKTLHKERRRTGPGRLSRSVTDEDLDELRGCIDLGFGFGDADVRSDDGSGGVSGSKLAETFPALELYYAMNRQYSELLAGDRSTDSSSAGSSPLSIYTPGDSPHKVKAKLKRWAQLVACSVRQGWRA